MEVREREREVMEVIERGESDEGKRNINIIK